MASGIPGRQLRTLLYGLKVTEPAAIVPQTGTAHIFTVAGGRVVITSLVGQVTAAASATATTLSIGVTPTVGTAAATGLATATAITSAEIGTLVSLPISYGALLVGVGAKAGGAVQAQGSGGYVVQPGTVDIVTSASNATAALSWTLTYVPLDDGATVVGV